MATDLAIPTPEEAARQLATIETVWPEIYEISDNAAYVQAGEILRDVKAEQKKLATLKRDLTKPIDEARQRILALFRPKEQRLTEVERSLKRGMAIYDARQEAQRRLIEAQLRDEQRRREEEARKEAERLRAEGKDDEADVVVALTPTAPPVVVADRPQVTGISDRVIYKYEVTDMWALIEHCVIHNTLDFLLPNDKVLGALARQTRGTAQIAGVRFYEERTKNVRV